MPDDDPQDWRVDVPQDRIDLYLELIERPRPLSAIEARMMVELVDGWRALEHRKHLTLERNATVPESDNELGWFAVRCVLHDRSRDAYEERVTLWQACDLDDAITLAEAEGNGYASALDATTYLGLAQAFQISDQPGHGAEIFSLIRDSALPPDEYLSTFFDTGTERQQTT